MSDKRERMTTSLDDIPADVLITMTDELERLFRAGGCNPTCHVCNKRLAIGRHFTLMSLNKRDEMVGDCCTRIQLVAKREKQSVARSLATKEYIEYKRLYPGYSRPSQQEASR